MQPHMLQAHRVGAQRGQSQGLGQLIPSQTALWAVALVLVAVTTRVWGRKGIVGQGQCRVKTLSLC